MDIKRGLTSLQVIGLVIILALIGFVAWSFKQRGNDVTPILPEQPVATTTQTQPANTKYKDGTYSATGNYTSPGGAEQIDVTLTLANNIVTNATVVSKTTSSPTAKRMQAAFIAGFSTLVVGKSIDSIKLTVVNGSSLTPKGFMDALAKIKVQAAA